MSDRDEADLHDRESTASTDATSADGGDIIADDAATYDEHVVIGEVEATDKGQVAPDAAIDDGKRQRPFWLELPILILLAFAMALVLKQFVVQAFVIPSESMLPVLQVEDRLLVDKLVYRFREPRRGEIIVFIAEKGAPQSLLGQIKSVLLEGFGFQLPDDVDYIKRVIGLPGETIELVKGTVFITPPGGERFALDEPYIEFPDDSDYGPTVVPEGHFFVLGDNRGASSDSRVSTRGPIAKADVIGRARLRIWPIGRIGRFPTPSYSAETG